MLIHARQLMLTFSVLLQPISEMTCVPDTMLLRESPKNIKKIEFLGFLTRLVNLFCSIL